jgi:hypothetical protein
MGIEPLPIDEPEDLLLKVRQARDRGRQAAARNDGAHEVDHQILDDLQHEA